MSKYLIITGASRGIGYQCARLFSEQGWHVINISRTHCDIASVINIEIDLTNSSWQEKHTSELLSHVNNADQIALVHNAGILYTDSISDVSADNFRKVMEINVIAPALLNQIYLPSMQQGSSIIYIGSTLSEKAVANNASYITSKHAIAGLMKSTCQDLAGSGIHTCCVCPGLTDTKLLRDRCNNDSEILASMEKICCAQRLIKPEEIAQLVWFSANNPVINGAMLPANLGQVES